MLALVKVTLAPVLAATALAWTLPAQAQEALTLAAMATLIAGVFVVTRYRQALEASDKSGEAIDRELSAVQKTAVRLQHENLVLQTEVTQLRSLPNLEQHAMLLSQLAALVSEQTGLLRDIRTAVMPPS